MLRSPERRNVAAFSLLVALAVGNAACGGGQEGDRSAGSSSSAPAASASAEPFRLAPRNAMELKQVPVGPDNRQRAWTPANPQPWGAGNEVQVDSRNSKPVGAPVGLYAEPRQEGNSPADAQDGQEYPAVCYADQAHGGAQFVQNDDRDGTYVWLRLDADRNGTPDLYLSSANAGFTGVNAQGQPDGRLPACP